MKRFGLALTVALACSQVQAAESLMTRQFRLMAEKVGTNYQISSVWLNVLPTVAEDCGLRIDKKSTLQWIALMGAGGPRREVMDTLSSDGVMTANWKDMLGSDKDEACRYVQSLWGDQGDVFPGVLTSR